MMNPLMGQVVEHADARELARAAADDFVAVAREAVQHRGRCMVALTGGSSPIELYRMLAERAVADRVPWDRLHLFWGDDRVVPPRHPRSNFRLADNLFIRPLGLAATNVHRIHGELGARRAAERYQAELRRIFGDDPRLDLVYLGLGDDGHVASLFPFDRESLHERTRFAIPALHPDLGEWRVTLTYPVICAARRVEFLLPSPDKARIARTAMHGPLDPIRVPAQGVRPGEGDLIWRLTRAVSTAAAALP